MNANMHKVISIQHSYECNKPTRCSFCYIGKRKTQSRPIEFWVGLIDFLKDKTEQFAWGWNGDDNFFNILDGIQTNNANNNDLILNITTNHWNLDKLADYLLAGGKKNFVKMVSVSLDTEKANSFAEWANSVAAFHNKLKNESGGRYKYKNEMMKIGVNLLMQDMFYYNLNTLLSNIFSIENGLVVDAVYMLQPKPGDNNISQIEKKLRSLAAVYAFGDDRVFIDACSNLLWFGSPCKRGQDLICIDPAGCVQKCSFENGGYQLFDDFQNFNIITEQPFFKEETIACPYLKSTIAS